MSAHNCAFAAYGKAFALIEVPNGRGYMGVPHLLAARYLHLSLSEELFIPLVTKLGGTVAGVLPAKIPENSLFSK